MSPDRDTAASATQATDHELDLAGGAPPPVGEEIHLPGGSILPLVVAIGITLTVIGTTIWIVWSVLGLVIFTIGVGLWIRDVRRDVDALPDEHHH
ncbi:MAG: hypothetical protein M0T77_05140 [Actinomycetota bacterium]|nr:hypothetical protein [Actinomycetota bacterium]